MNDFGGETPYSIMFGPDICGYTTKKVHVIFTKNDKNHLIKKDIPAQTDELTHVYTLHLKPDNTFKVCRLSLCCHLSLVQCPFELRNIHSPLSDP
jgi:calreticulin